MSTSLIFSPLSESLTRKVGLRQSFFLIFCGMFLSSSIFLLRSASSGSASLHFSRMAMMSSFTERLSSCMM